MKTFANFLTLFTQKGKVANRVVGIDIGSSSIKVVEVQDRDGVLTLTTYGEIQLGPYDKKPVGESLILEDIKEQQALIDILREAAVKANTAVFAMPLSSSFVTAVSFEADQKEDLGSKVRVEARKYIPVPINEVTLDWAEINLSSGKNKDKATKNRDVLLAAIQNDALKRFRTLMQFVNLREPPTEIECFSAIRSVHTPEESNIAVIDVGAVSTKLYIARDGLLQRMHRLRAGGAIATKRITDTLQLSFEAAELLKREITRDHAQYRDVVRAHQSCYERPLSELKQVIKEYEKQVGTTLAAVYVAGSGSLFPGFKQELADVLQCEVRSANPFTKVAHPAFMEDMIGTLGPTFNVALGAALRAFE